MTKVLLSLSLTVFLGCSENTPPTSTDVQSQPVIFDQDTEAWSNPVDNQPTSPDSYTQGRIADLDRASQLLEEFTDEIRASNNSVCKLDIESVLPQLDPSKLIDGDITIESYEAQFNELVAQWDTCVLSTNNDTAIQASRPSQAELLNTFESLRTLIPFMHEIDRGFFEEFINFFQEVVLSDNTSCQEEMSADPDFLYLQENSFLYAMYREAIQRRFNSIKEKWNACVNQ